MGGCPDTVGFDGGEAGLLGVGGVGDGAGGRGWLPMALAGERFKTT